MDSPLPHRLALGNVSPLYEEPIRVEANGHPSGLAVVFAEDAATVQTQDQPSKFYSLRRLSGTDVSLFQPLGTSFAPSTTLLMPPITRWYDGETWK